MQSEQSTCPHAADMHHKPQVSVKVGSLQKALEGSVGEAGLVLHWSTIFNSRTELGTGAKDTQEEAWRETIIFKAICHHSLQNHCLSGITSSSPCRSSRKVPSDRALSKWETGSILTSALGLGSPTVPASHTPPAH